jgi:hypothetical protein
MLLEELVKTHRRIVAIGFILLVIGCGLPGRASTQSTRGAREQILGLAARVHEQEGTITHRVEGSLFPEDLGKDFQRRFRIDGDELTLSFTSTSAERVEITRTLRFRRAKS